MRKDLIDNALHHSRPGDVLFMASESRSGDVAGLLAAANTLRNLMAYPAAVEVLDMVLAADSANVRALEQKALCLARQGGEFAGQAESVLDTAISLVGSDPAPDNESLSIMARLNKERWCRSWFDVGAPESDAQIEENCRLAAQESFFLWAAIDCCLDAFSQTQSYYTAINAATLCVTPMFPEYCTTKRPSSPCSQMNGLLSAGIRLFS